MLELSFEAKLRLGSFMALFILFAVSESLRPRRDENMERAKRWPANLLIVGLGQLCLQLIFPLLAVEMALEAQTYKAGLFHLIEIPYPLQVFLSILVLDLAIYGQHVTFHSSPILFRLHRVHHTDLHFDVSTGVRFHPIEIILSMGIKIFIVISLGLPAFGVMLFEILLSSTSLFNHTNWKIPIKVEKLLRLILVTPDMHRVHHSTNPVETNSNFGFSLSFWDRLFKTYRKEPILGHEQMEIGLKEYRDPKILKLWPMLKNPFLKR